jgi:hypothetical protein
VADLAGLPTPVELPEFVAAAARSASFNAHYQS